MFQLVSNILLHIIAPYLQVAPVLLQLQLQPALLGVLTPPEVDEPSVANMTQEVLHLHSNPRRLHIDPMIPWTAWSAGWLRLKYWVAGVEVLGLKDWVLGL
jgi:hypothetical protein